MQSVSAAWRVVALVALLTVLIATPAAYGDEGNPYEPPAGRIGPPIGLTNSEQVSSSGRIGPPIGAPGTEPPSGRIGPPLPTTRERMTLADRFWTWLQARIGSPLSLN